MPKTPAALLALLATIALAAAAPAPAQNPFTPGMRSIKIAVKDFQKSIAFYTALGMKPGTNRGATWDLVWEAGSYNSGILMASPDYAKNAKMAWGGTYIMVTTSDVKAVADKLRSQGYPDVAEPRAMGTMATVLLLRDPDGNQVELLGPLPAK